MLGVLLIAGLGGLGWWLMQDGGAVEPRGTLKPLGRPKKPVEVEAPAEPTPVEPTAAAKPAPAEPTATKAPVEPAATAKKPVEAAPVEAATKPPVPTKSAAVAATAPKPRPVTAATPAPTPAPSTPGARGTTGTLVVKAQAHLEVLLDGKVIGTTPLRAEVPIGGHELEVRAPGQDHGTGGHINVQYGNEYAVNLD